jgi:putative transposase
MARGFLYLVAVMDWFSRYVLSWRLLTSLRADFCVDALEEALDCYAVAPKYKSSAKSAQ